MDVGAGAGGGSVVSGCGSPTSGVDASTAATTYSDSGGGGGGGRKMDLYLPQQYLAGHHYDHCGPGFSPGPPPPPPPPLPPPVRYYDIYDRVDTRLPHDAELASKQQEQLQQLEDSRPQPQQQPPPALLHHHHHHHHQQQQQPQQQHHSHPHHVHHSSPPLPQSQHPSQQQQQHQHQQPMDNCTSPVPQQYSAYHGALHGGGGGTVGAPVAMDSYGHYDSRLMDCKPGLTEECAGSNPMPSFMFPQHQQHVAPMVEVNGLGNGYAVNPCMSPMSGTNMAIYPWMRPANGGRCLSKKSLQCNIDYCNINCNIQILTSSSTHTYTPVSLVYPTPTPSTKELLFPTQ